MPTQTPPHLLLVEDDPVSAEFMRHALEALPARVDVAGSVAEARLRAAAARHDLWLIDARLPDGHGADLLAALRALNPATPALAHTADAGEPTRRALREAGFAGVAVKPLKAAELRDQVAGALPPRDWNDEQALRALAGQAAHVAALRGLFLDELPSVRAEVRDAARRGDPDALHEVLHRLKASCAFVGADRLGHAVRALHAAPGSAGALARFMDAADALADRGGSAADGCDGSG